MTRSETELWEARASAAEDAATQVERLKHDLEKVLSVYYLGADCIEGQELHSALLNHFGGVANMLAGSVNDAWELAANCRSAAQALAVADDTGAEVITHGLPG